MAGRHIRDWIAILELIMVSHLILTLIFGRRK